MHRAVLLLKSKAFVSPDQTRAFSASTRGGGDGDRDGGSTSGGARAVAR